MLVFLRAEARSRDSIASLCKMCSSRHRLRSCLSLFWPPRGILVMEATRMKVHGVISTTALCLLLGAIVPTFAQEDGAKPGQHEEEAKPAAKPEETKPPKQEEQPKTVKPEATKPPKQEEQPKTAKQEEAKPQNQEQQQQAKTPQSEEKNPPQQQAKAQPQQSQ